MDDQDFTLPSSKAQSAKSKTTVGECQAACLHVLQDLNNLCASGYRLAQSLSALEQGDGVAQTAYATAWKNLATATNLSTSTVKSHVVRVLQDLVILPDTTTGQRESIDIQLIRIRNQQIFMETAQTMIDIQHQFCMASCNSFSILKYCFMYLVPAGFPHDRNCAIMPPASHRNQAIRGPNLAPSKLLIMKTPYLPWNNQRRSSEADAEKAKRELSMICRHNQMRRWSIPYESPSTTVENALFSWDQTNITPIASSDSYASSYSTSESNCELSATSQDNLAQSIQLLSIRANSQQSNQKEQSNQ